MVTNNVTVYQFEVGLDEVFADEVRFHVNVDCVIVVVVKDCLFFMSFILCENCEFVNSNSRFLLICSVFSKLPPKGHKNTIFTLSFVHLLLRKCMPEKKQ